MNPTPFLPFRRVYVACAAAILIGRLVAALLIIPPWQMPDEQIHVAIVEVWRTRLAHTLTDDPGREQEILASMHQYRWWQRYGVPEPSRPLPTRFSAAPASATIGLDPQSSDYPKVFYGGIAALLSLVPRMSVATDMYVLRGVAALFGVATLIIAFAASRTIGGAAATIGAALLALHPQFAAVATMAAPDAFIDCAAAFIWWQALVALQHRHPIASLAAVWGVALLAALADRMGLALIVLAAVISVFAIWRRRLVQPIVIVPAIALILAGSVAYLRTDPSIRAGLDNAAGAGLLSADARTSGFFLRFHEGLFSSWWFTLGWGKFVPPHWWTNIAFVIVAVAVCGIAIAISRGDLPEQATLALTMFAIQMSAVYYVYYRNGVGAQGRHLFPVLLPTLYLLSVGWDSGLPLESRRGARMGLLLAVALLDAIAWLAVAIPVYGHG